jgi:hypothetical protein
MTGIMKKQKRPNAAKPTKAAKAALPAEAPEDKAAQTLTGLALDLTELDDYATVPEELKKKQNDALRLIRKCLQQKRDAVLGEALDRVYEEDPIAFDYLKGQIQDASENVIFRREDGPDVEVNAFVIPLFARTVGGLRLEQCFQDEAAFQHLHESIQDSQLESAKARVVLVSHAYHLDEIDRISYSQLHDMVREAYEWMTRKKPGAAPAITASMSGWPDNSFAPDDNAVELRFLLGFTLKSLDDPFYRIPEKEAAADRYFEARAERFRKWSREVTPLVKRCLVTDNREVDIDFLYQDLFYGGKAAGIAEYAVLQMMSACRHALQENGVSAEEVHAIVGPADGADGLVLRVALHARQGDNQLASFDKPVSSMSEMRNDAGDVCDALMTIGLTSLSLAEEFDDEGKPLRLRPYAAE